MKELHADVLVVGAGPAGCATATFLARDGFDVLAIDRAVFPRDKVCGDGLAPRSVAMLRRLGVEARLRASGHEPIHSYRIVGTWGEAVKSGMPSFGKAPNYAYVVPRRETDALIVQTAREAGVEVLEGVWARRLENGSDSSSPVVLAQTSDGEPLRLRGRVVVAADGSRGSFSRTIMPAYRLEPYAVGIRAYMEGVEGTEEAMSFFLDRNLLPGYGWIFPPSRREGTFNVGLGVKLTALRKRPERLRDLFDWFLGPESGAWRYLRNARLVSPPATFPLQASYLQGLRREGSILFAGDSANLIDPLSGEGVAYALESGQAAAEVLGRALRSGAVLDLAAYEQGIRRGLGAEFFGARILRQVLQQPWGNGLVIKLLRRDQALARGAMGVLSNSIPAPWLLKPVVWRRLASPELIGRTVRAAMPARG